MISPLLALLLVYCTAGGVISLIILIIMVKRNAR